VGVDVDDDPEVVVVVLVVVVDVVSVGVDVDDVSVGVVVVVPVVSVDVGGGVVSVVPEDETAVVPVVPDEDVLLPAETLPRAPAARRPMTNKAAIPTAVHDFFCGPPFFANGAIYSPSLSYAAQSTYNCRRVDARIPQ
jgi:hypothetical protein